MPTMNINLTDEFARFVSGEIAAGEYASASEMVRDALRLMRRDRELDAYKLQMLKQHIDLGLSQGDNGDYSDRTVMQIATSILDEDDV
ncbi:type II toxin-antitoxin system ParD family antitoxin [uncultured Devosia sp.]|uniref:type II toxin-antitoxin system ParD family antitoxin n=1 Tax=uncultured Devosia sp. TaxID=211434 RepID=UPI0035CAD689